MTTAIRKVHLHKGLWNTGGGYEFNLALVAAAIALIDSGPGRPAVDEALGLELKGSGWALAALTAGVAGSSAVIELAQRMPAQDGEASRGGRFERAAQGADQSVPAENPA